MMRIYEGDKIDALCSFMNITPEDIHVWSDNSLTIGDNDTTEYYVTKGKRKYDALLGRQDGFNIYKRN